LIYKQYGLPIYATLTLLHLFITIAFSLAQVAQAIWPTWTSMQASAEQGAGWQWLAVQGTVALCVLPFLFFEFIEGWREGFRAYFSDPANWVEMINIFGVMTPIPYFYMSGEPLGETVRAILILTTWLRVLQYLKAYELTGSLMRMIIAILSKMRVFFLIMSIFIIGYVFSFLVLFPNRLQFRATRIRVFITFFEAMLGEPTMMQMFNDPGDPQSELNMTVRNMFFFVQYDLDKMLFVLIIIFILTYPSLFPFHFIIT